jgi:muconate cycloisomerase
MRMAGRAITDAETVIIKLVTTTQEIGWGEANIAPALTGQSRDDTLLSLEQLGDCLNGQDVRNIGDLMSLARRLLPKATACHAAIDMAVHDVVARRLGISVSRLQGGREAVNAPFVALIDSSDPGAMADCKKRAAEGVRLLKVKVANGPLESEIEFMRQVRRDRGPAMLLAVDANGGWCLDDAAAFCAGVADLDILFVEQPLPPEQLAQTAKLASSGKVAIGADESIGDATDIVRCRLEGRVAGVSLKLLKAGGLRRVRDASAVAGAMKLSVNLSGKVGETSLANAATLHLASALPHIDWGVSVTAAYLADDIVSHPMGITGSRDVLCGPGLGVAVDETRLADLAVPRPAKLSPAHGAI